MIERRAAGELRAAPGRRIIGAAMRYGAEARVLLHGETPIVERFASFAFSAYLRSGAATVLNLQHDKTLAIATTGTPAGRGKLQLRDHPDGLDLVATLPTGDAFDRALALVADGSTAQTSVEFRALREVREGDRRTVLEATLPAIGIVDQGAYGVAGAVEVRRAGGLLVARVPYRTRLDCECVTGNCDAVLFEDNSFEVPDEALAVLNTFAQPLGALSKGSLRLLADDDGLQVTLDLADPDTHEATRALLQAALVTPVYARPYLLERESTYTELADIRTYQTAHIRAIILGAADRAAGLEPAELREPRRASEPERRHHRDRERQQLERALRGRRVWL